MILQRLILSSMLVCTPCITASSCTTKIEAAMNKIDRFFHYMDSCEQSCQTWLLEHRWAVGATMVAFVCYALYDQYRLSQKADCPPARKFIMPVSEQRYFPEARSITLGAVSPPTQKKHAEIPAEETKPTHEENIVTEQNRKKEAVAEARHRAEQEQLQVIEGNGVQGSRRWNIPAHAKISAEGGRSEILVSGTIEGTTLEIMADENILDYFIVKESETEFSVTPQEGLLLISHTPVILRLQARNLSVPVSLRRGTRVVSLT